MEAHWIGDGDAKALRASCEASQSVFTELSIGNVSLVHDDCCKKRQSARMTNIEQSIEVTVGPIHLMPRFGPFDTACRRQGSVGGASLIDRLLF
jgi:hypothetical protein